MKQHFPTHEALATAPVFDVAGIMLELLGAHPSGGWVSRNNIVCEWAREYGRNGYKYVIRPLSEAWAWLENNGFLAEQAEIMGAPGTFVTRAGRQVVSRSAFLAYAQRHLLPKEMLRNDMAAVVLPLFLGGHFDQAVQAAFLQVEVFVREAAELPADLVGVQLMRKAFHPEGGPLTDMSLVIAERQGLSDLFAGAFGFYRNPFNHQIVGLSKAVQAASIILLANELLVTANGLAQIRQDRI